MTRLFTGLSMCALCAFVLAPNTTSAQAPAADASAYVGSWTLHMTGQMLGQFDMKLKIANEGGKVVGEVLSGPLGTPKSTGAVKNDKELALNFTFDFMGAPIDGDLVLRPTGAKYNAAISVMGGGFVIPGEAERTGQSN